MTAAANLSARNNEGQPVAVNVGNALQPSANQVLTATSNVAATWQSLPSNTATTPVTLTDAATVTVNAAASDYFRLTLGGNRTLGTPSNPTDGQQVLFEVIQPASGGPYTLSYSGAYSFPASVPQPVLSTAANDHDFISFVYNSGTALWTCTGYVSAQNSGLVTIAQGGTGQTTAAAAYNALSPMTTLGDLEYESGTATAARLAGNTSTQVQFLSQTGTGSASSAPTWSVVSGQYLCAPKIYAPTVATAVNVTTSTYSAFSSGTICTNAFTAPASGSVVVTASFAANQASAGATMTFALTQTGGTTPIYGMAATYRDTAGGINRPYTLEFVPTGLTVGSGYQFDLLGATSSAGTALTIEVLGVTAPPSGGTYGAPVIMTVRAV